MVNDKNWLQPNFTISIQFMIWLSLEILAPANYPSFVFRYILGKVWLKHPFDSMVQFIENYPMILAYLGCTVFLGSGFKNQTV